MTLPHCFFYVLVLLAVDLDAFSQTTASADFYKGEKLYEQGYYDSAATSLQKSMLAGDSLNLKVLCLYGEALSQAGQFAPAKPPLQQALQLAENQQDIYYQTKALLLLGDVHLREGQLQAAGEMYQKARQAYAQKAEDTLTASVYRRLGFVTFSQGQYEEAGRYAHMAFQLMVSQLPENHVDWANYYKLLGAINDRQADYDSALYYYEKSLAIYRQVYGDRHPETAKLLVNLANVLHVRGANVQAVRYFTQALATLQEFLGKDHIVVAVIYNNMAIIDFDLGNFEKAIVYYQHALHIFGKKMGSQSMQVAQFQNNIASAYLEMEDGQKALQYAFQSLKIREQQLDANNMLLVPVFVNLAGANILQHQFAKANAYSRKAIDILKSHGEESHPGLAEAYTGLGESYLGQQQPKRALNYFSRARKVSLDLYGEHHAKLAFIYNLTGDAYRQLHQLDSALSYYNRAISAVLPGYDPDRMETLPKAGQNAYVAQHYLLDALIGRAETLYMQYQKDPKQGVYALTKAYQVFNYLSSLIDNMRNAYQREESKLFLSKIATPVYARALEVTWNLYQRTQDPQYARKAFGFSEKSKYVLLSDFLNDVTAKSTAGIPEDVLDEEQNLKSQIAYYEKQIFEVPGDSAKARNEPLLTESKKAYMDFVDHLEKEYPRYYELKYKPQTASVEEVQHILKKNEQLIEYALADSALYIFSIQADTMHFERLEPEEALQPMVMQMRKGLQEQDYAAYTQNAWKLYQLLAAGWSEKQDKVIIIPAGVLGYIPFEVLLTRKMVGNTGNYWQLPFLLEDYTISYNYSATFYLSEQSKRAFPSYKNFMVGFAPDFDADTSMLAYTEPGKVERNSLVHLQGAQQELKKIAEVFQGKFFFGPQATEANFKQAIRNTRLIHLGTHGILDDENPAMSRLAFSATGDSLEDNLLHTYEIYNLKLNAELVTLSACNTGTGQLREGEGVMSLARGFAYAGCPNVVTSLWPASDYATAQLMQRFYYYLSNGWEKDKALRQAKLDFLEKADENLANPYYWGSFILVGDAKPLQMVNYKWLIWLISIGAVLTLGWFFYRKLSTGNS